MNIDEKGLNISRTETVQDILDLLKNNDRVACVRYTGYGKSYYIVTQLVNKLNKPILIVVPNAALQEQYKELFSDNKNVQIITYQIIKNFTDLYITKHLLKYKYIICDECHHLGNNKWRKHFDKLNNIVKAKIIGLTATPLRGDNVNVVEQYFNNVQVDPLELIDGISLNYVPKIRYVVAYASIDNIQDYKLKEIDRYKIQNLINIPNILKKHIPKEVYTNNMKVLVYVPAIKYINEGINSCKNWFKQVFPAFNINTYSIHSKKDTTLNKQELTQFKQYHSNSIDIMVSVDMLTEGLHLPTINVEIMLRKTKSPVTYFQQVGRVINGQQPIVFDLINNSSHLYQMKRQYKLNINELQNRQLRKPKVMFSDCIELYDETVEITQILQKYENQKICKQYRVVPVEIELQIIKETDLTLNQICAKYSVCYATVSKILKKYNVSRGSMWDKQQLQKIFEDNKELIVKNNGVISRQITAKQLGIPEQRLRQLMQENNIPIKRMYPPIEKNDEILNELIKLYNSKVSKSSIMESLNLDKREYNSYLELARKQHKLTKFSNTYDKANIIQWIKDNGQNLTTTQISDQLNIPINIIRDITNNYNIPHKVSKVATIITPDIEQTVLQQYLKIGSLYGVHKELGLHKNTIKKILLRHNIQINKPTNPNNTRLSNEEEQLIIDYYKQNKSVKEICELVNRGQAAVRKIINKYKSSL